MRAVARQLASLASATAELPDGQDASPDDDVVLQLVVPADLDGTADDMDEA